MLTSAWNQININQNLWDIKEIKNSSRLHKLIPIIKIRKKHDQANIINCVYVNNNFYFNFY